MGEGMLRALEGDGTACSGLIGVVVAVDCSEDVLDMGWLLEGRLPLFMTFEKRYARANSPVA